MKKYIIAILTFSTIGLACYSMHLHSEISSYKASNTLENKNVSIEYSENKNGTYEVYVDLKSGQRISEAQISNNKDSVIIAPDKN
ncbi:hypothetical protein ACP8H2_09850 [Bacillus subtilis]|uniref:hypothetical protein n=1 Tax=Bacillus subtilis TaxID=1423 RepID=UPI003CFB63F1